MSGMQKIEAAIGEADAQPSASPFRQAFVEHYKKAGFREKRIIDSDVERGLCEELGYDPARDTLLALDLQQWRARTR